MLHDRQTQTTDMDWAEKSTASEYSLPLEIRIHGRGGQGGVTCAKIIALIYAEMGLHVQTFADYGSERAGAPVRAFTRLDKAPITNRNKVYHPDHLLVLDSKLLGSDVLDGVASGAVLLINNAENINSFAGQYEALRLATVDATSIARKHGIGTSAVVIINTTIAGAYTKTLGLPWEVVEKAYNSLGLTGDLGAAKEAYDTVAIREPSTRQLETKTPNASQPIPPVLGLVEHTQDIPTPMKTGPWRTQLPQYKSHLAPCNAACPAGNDVVGFVQALKTEGAEAAARVLYQTQALPSICGRVCPAPCMSSCNRKTYDGAVNIRGLERWIADHAEPIPEPRRKAAHPRRVAIIGSGPAGLSAAFALGREGHAVTLFESAAKLGGVLRYGIPDYRLPPAILDRDIDRILALGITACCDTPMDAAAIEALSQDHDAVILATGLETLTELNCPGSTLKGIGSGISYLQLVKQGTETISDEHTVVIGGGNTAVDCARTALRLGARQVTLVYRRSQCEMPAIEEEIEDALAEGVKLLCLRQPIAFVGTNTVTGLELAEVELAEADASGRRRPVVTEKRQTIDCDRVLLALGQSPDTSILPPDWSIHNGRIQHQGKPGNLWLTGDLQTQDGTVTHAVGHGRRVAALVLSALAGKKIAEITSSPSQETMVSPAHVRYSHFEVALPARERQLSAGNRAGSFDEANLGLADPAEAERCFSCGRCTQCDTCLLYCPEGIIERRTDGYSINQDYCKGCGMCVAECPRMAMAMNDDSSDDSGDDRIERCSA